MNGIRFLTVTALLCAAPLAGAAGTSDHPETAAISQQHCCFENPRFSGTCEVTPGPEESCGAILAYLNNPNSVGKNYCGNTKVRGGWSQVACGEKTATLAGASVAPTACSSSMSRQR